MEMEHEPIPRGRGGKGATEMKRLKRITRIAAVWLLALMAALCGLSAGAEEMEELDRLTNKDGFVYTVLEDGSAQIVGYTGGQKKVAIPAKLDDQPVTSIGDKAFRGNAVMQSVLIPDSVTRIGNDAFANCIALKDAPMPKKLVSLGRGVFWDCKKLDNVGTLPETLTDVGENPFPNCQSLKSVKVAGKNPYLEVKGGVLFSKGDSRRLIWYPIPAKAQAYTVPDGTERIDVMAFYGSSVTKVTVPESVSEIGATAFGNCVRLTEVSLPSQVRNLSSVFSGCMVLKTVRVSEDNPWYEAVDGVLFTRENRTLALYPVGRTETAYTVPEGTVVIGDGAFEHTRLTSVELPGSLRHIGFSAFGFTELRQVVIPEGVETLDLCVFQGCFSLEEVTLPRSLNLDQAAFFGAFNLRRVVLDADHPTLALEDDCLYSRETGKLLWYSPCAERESLTLPAGVRIVAEDAMSNGSLRELTLPEGVTEIEEDAFSGCDALTRMVLPATLTRIAEHTLQSTGTAVAEEPERVTYVVPAGSYAESYCRLYELTYEVVP